MRNGRIIRLPGFEEICSFRNEFHCSTCSRCVHVVLTLVVSTLYSWQASGVSMLPLIVSVDGDHNLSPLANFSRSSQRIKKKLFENTVHVF